MTDATATPAVETAPEEPKTAEKPPERPQSAARVLADELTKRQSSFAAVATRYLPTDRLLKLAAIVIAKNAKIAQCTLLSLVDCMVVCAKLGLEPNEPGGVWIVPFKVKTRGKNGREEWQYIATPIVDYRGLLDVARRSGEIAAVHTALRHERDAWEFWVDSTSPSLIHLKHVPAEGDRGSVLGAYFVVRLKNDQCHAIFLTTEQIEFYRSRSRAKDSGPWTTDWSSMAQKTAVRRGINLLPRTPEVQLLRETIAAEDAFEFDDPENTIDVQSEALSIPPPRRRSEVKPSPAVVDESVETPSAGRVTIQDVQVNQNKGASVRTSTGEVLGTADPEIIGLLKVAKAQGSAVELVTDQGVIVEATILV